MKFILSIIICIFSYVGYSQSFFRVHYDRYFPNNKSIQIARLNAKIDSLKNLNDSLKATELVALEKINNQKSEIISLKSDLYAEQEKNKNACSSSVNEVIVLRDSIKKLTFPIVSCKEELITTKGQKDPILLNTCNWNGFQIIEKGTPDSKSRYTWVTEWYRVKNDSLTKISQLDIFKSSKISELEKLINIQLEEDFKALRLMDPTCFKGRKTYRPFKMKDMRMSITENSELNFEIVYGLPISCYAVNASSVSFKIEALKDYFAE